MQLTQLYSRNHTESFDLWFYVRDETITPQRAALSEPVLIVQFTLKKGQYELRRLRKINSFPMNQRFVRNQPNEPLPCQLNA